MNDILLSAGAACVILAVVGGGAKAFGVEIPVLNSVRRQVALGVVGIGFLAAAFVVGNGSASSNNSGNPAVAAYQQEVLAACRAAKSAASGGSLAAALNADGTFDRDRFVAGLRDQTTAWSSVWQELWRHPVPDELQAKASAAQQAASDVTAQTRAAVDEIPAQLPARFTYPELAAVAGRLNAASGAPVARLEGAMSELAGQPCSVSAPAASG